VSSKQDMQRETKTQEHMDLPTKSPQVKRPNIKESPHAQKKSKTAKILEKDFLDSSELARDVTTGALKKLMTKQINVLG